MKLWAISILPALLTVPLSAEDRVSVNANSPWKTVALRAQAQLEEHQLAVAAETAKQALRMAKPFGSSDGRVAASYHLLGIVYREWWHCAEARSNFRHAIPLWLRQPQPNARYIFNAITSLVSVMAECDDFVAAEKTLRSYRAELEHYSSDVMDNAKLLSLEGVMARGRKKYEEAEKLYRRAIALTEPLADPAAPTEIAIDRTSMAVVIDKQGRHEESLAESLRAVAYFEQFKPGNNTLIAALNNAACSLADLGRKEEAERMFERALQKGRELFGEDNQHTALIMLSYARVLRENKESPAASDFQKRGVEAYKRALARDHASIDVDELRSTKK